MHIFAKSLQAGILHAFVVCDFLPKIDLKMKFN